MTDEGKKVPFWTPSNVVTIIRICLVPLFVVVILSPWPAYFNIGGVVNSVKSWVAVAIFILIAATDGVDGYLARRRGELTNFGKIVDPLADKILVAAALVVLIELGDLPSWVVLIFLAREFVVAGVRMFAASKGIVIAASWLGKTKTVLQIIAIVLFIVKHDLVLETFSEVFQNPLYLVSWAFMFAAIVVTIWSMIDYIVKSRDIFSSDTSDIPCAEELHKLAQQIVDSAKDKGVTLGTAESLTGGLIAATLTDIPGSSACVRGGVVSYATEVKSDVLGVESATVEQDGVVSERTACEMAEGACKQLKCDLAVAVTGIAGPDGGTDEIPVGTVWMARAGSVGGGAETVARCYHFEGDREQVRLSTVHEALNLFLELL